MASDPQVYQTTTVKETKPKCFQIPSDCLDKPRFAVKVVEVILSSVAFVLEELVLACVSCYPLYFFEFVSCLAVLFTLLLLILLSTHLHQNLQLLASWPSLDLGYTAGIAFLFLIASIVFISDNGGSELEIAAAVFGFLATVAFVVDAAMHIKAKGNPFCMRSQGPQSSSQRAPAEMEKLNSNGRNDASESA